jgi:hypothetical protein
VYDGGLGSIAAFFGSQTMSILVPCNVPPLTLFDITNAANVCGPPRFFELTCSNQTGTVLDPNTGEQVPSCLFPGQSCPDTCTDIGPFVCSSTALAQWMWIMCVLALVGECIRQLFGMMMWCGFGTCTQIDTHAYITFRF